MGLFLCDEVVIVISNDLKRPATFYQELISQQCLLEKRMCGILRIIFRQNGGELFRQKLTGEGEKSRTRAATEDTDSHFTPL